MKNLLKNIVRGCFLIVIGLSTACSGTPVNFATGQNPPLDLEHGRSIKAEACGFQLFLLIPIAINGRQERAYESLRMQSGSDFITDVAVKESWVYGFVGTAYCTELTAMAYPRKVAGP